MAGKSKRGGRRVPWTKKDEALLLKYADKLQGQRWWELDEVQFDFPKRKASALKAKVNKLRRQQQLRVGQRPAHKAAKAAFAPAPVQPEEHLRFCPACGTGLWAIRSALAVANDQS
jgi:hypothetical protein